MVTFIRQLQEISGEGDLEDVRGNALSLARMFNAGFPVPPALTVTVEAYEAFLQGTGLRDRISLVLADLDFDDEDSLRKGSAHIRAMIGKEPFPPLLDSTLRSSVPSLGAGLLAVRSSAVAEDVFFITKEEVFEHASASALSPEVDLQRRRMEFMRNRNSLPPKFLHRNLEFDDSMMRSDDGSQISGTSASPSICTAQVRVVDSIKGISGIQAGEMPVTGNTDPGWTADKNATTLLHSGQTVTLDGNRGCIINT